MDKQLFLSYYGDDFTGSTDVMEALTINGIPTALFLNAPTEKEVDAFKLKNTSVNKGKIQAFGVAGLSRTMGLAQMDKELPKIFEKISKIPSAYFHYKICSTFDSSPNIGNIGHAVDIALQYFPSRWIPLLVAAPALNRFCVFGNLFARANGLTYRLDRHPTMSKHPVTPMLESDLPMHLSKQTSRKTALIDINNLDTEQYIQEEALVNLIKDQNPSFVLFDTLNNQHLLNAGKLIRKYSKEKRQLIVGSSGVEYALLNGVQKTELNIIAPQKAQNCIVITGSCSPGTQRQIEYAIANGFTGIRINTQQLADIQTREQEIERLLLLAEEALKKDHPIVLYSALGPDDHAIQNTKKSIQNSDGKPLGEIQGILLKKLLEKHGKSRVVVAGGDTSGHVSRTLEIQALELLIPIAPGAPLCIAHSLNPNFDGLEIALKGGQNGDEKYFIHVLNGKAD